MLEKIIIPIGYGRTCNQLFQISHWFPVSIENNIPLYFPGFSKYNKLFKGTSYNNESVFPFNSKKLSFYNLSFSQILKYSDKLSPKLYTNLQILNTFNYGNVSYELNDSGNEGMLSPRALIINKKVSCGKTLWAKGWLYRDPEGVTIYSDIIRNYFSPIDNVASKINQFVLNARRGFDILIGVHLRRGDYRFYNDGEYYFDDTVFSSYLKELEYLFGEFKIRFLIVSNEVINFNNYSNFAIIKGLGDSIGDLYSLASCDYIIGPPSTYTAWASWYGQVPRYEIVSKKRSIKLTDFKTVVD